MLDLFNKILVIAAHPDDEVLGVGGTIAKLIRKEKKVDILIFTDGSSTQYIDDEEKLENKFLEAKKSTDILGANLLPRLDFPDMKLDTIAHVDKNRALTKIISEGGYDTVFVQDTGDINKDHEEVFNSTIVACRPYPGQKVKNLLSYYVNSSSEWGGILKKSNFQANIFVDITDTIKSKLEAMEAYKTELRDYPHPRSIEGIRNSAKYFGNTIGVDCVEPFRLIFSKL